MRGRVCYGIIWYSMVRCDTIGSGRTLPSTALETNVGRYGIIWYGMAWYGMVWYSVEWYGVVWFGMICFGPV